MEKILGTILVIIIIFYLLAFLSRLILPYFFKRAMKKAEKNMRQQFGGFAQDDEEPRRPEGDVTIKYQKTKDSGKTSLSDELGGEYVDFEEVK